MKMINSDKPLAVPLSEGLGPLLAGEERHASN